MRLKRGCCDDVPRSSLPSRWTFLLHQPQGKVLAATLQFLSFNNNRTLYIRTYQITLLNIEVNMSGRGNTGIILGALAATGGAYYLYQAGGDPKVAEKKLERTQSP